MKVFEFHPATGTIGEQIDTRRCASWGDCSLKHLKAEGFSVPEYKLPSRTDATFDTHIDAGSESVVDGKLAFVSYRHETKWLAFCVGQSQCGLYEGIWIWWIIPSKEAYVPTDEIYVKYQSRKEGVAA